MPTRTALPVLLACAALLAAACTRTDDGAATAGSAPPATSAAPSAESSTEPSQSTATSTPIPEPGVVPTTAPAASCEPETSPSVTVTARTADPAAPTATVAVPTGWSMSTGPDGTELTGPDGIRASVTITPTDADPETAFRDYSDALTRDTALSTVSLLPGELCAFSGQELMGTLSPSDRPTDPVEYRARIVHIETAGHPYLIAVHVEAPSGAPGFDAAAVALTGDFAIGIP